MHMGDALITPVVGGISLAASAGMVGYSVRSLKTETFEQRLPLMGVMGAFLFAAQMINFTIPGTGSSGHIGGGLLLATILGPGAGFITLACVLLIQALFFADGGILAYGCNLINIGFFTIFLAYPFIFQKIVKKGMTKKRIITASILASVIGLQLGSLGVVMETLISGRTELNLTTFIMFMQPIHLAIGLVEGIITGLIVSYLYSQNEGLIYSTSQVKQEKTVGITARNIIGSHTDHTQGVTNVSTAINTSDNTSSSTLSSDSEKERTTENTRKNDPIKKKMIIGILVAAIVVGGLVSLFASPNPDGLEWAIANTTNEQGVVNNSPIISWVEATQSKLALLPDYSFKNSSGEGFIGTTASGILGSFITLGLAVFIGITIRWKRKQSAKYE